MISADEPFSWPGWLRFQQDTLLSGGGLAIAEAHVQETANVIATGGTYLGWSIGGDIDYAITHNLVGRIEYLYDDYGHKDYTGVSGDMYRVSLTGQTLRGALIWKFDPTGMKP
jgi:outer membrane immunogenic protein